MGELFNDIVAFVGRDDVLTALTEEFDDVSADQGHEGAVLSAAAVVGSLARWVERPDGREWVETELPAIDASLDDVPELLASDDYYRFGHGVVTRLFGSGQDEVAAQVGEWAELRQHSALVVLSTAAWITAGHLARHSGRGPEAVTAALRAEDDDLRDEGWGPWIDAALTSSRPEGPTGAPVGLPTGPLERVTLSTDGEPAGAALYEPDRSGRRRAVLAVAAVAVAAAAAGALLFWLGRSGDQLATDEPTATTTTAADAETDNDTAPAEGEASTTTTTTTEPSTTTTVGAEAEQTANDAEPELPTTDLPETVEYSLTLTDTSGGDAEGTVELALDTVTGEVCYAFDLAGITPPYVAHLHVGPSATDGGITVDFGSLEPVDRGCVQAHPADVVAAAVRPAARYVEAHDPSGAFTLRAQLEQADGADQAAAPPEPVDIGDRAHVVIVDGTVVLRGAVADQEALDAFVARHGDLDGSIPVVNDLVIEAGAGEPTDVVVIDDTVRFDFDSVELNDEANGVLARLAPILIARPDWMVTAVGHTDSTGSPFYNFSLSLRRASAVQQALIGLGVDRLAVTAQGFGPVTPIASNDTSDGRAENRRIEFQVNTGR